MHPWHALSWAEVANIFSVKIERGLSSAEVAYRRQEFGKNSFTQKKSWRLSRLLLSQLKSPLVIILFIAAGILILLEDYADAIIIGIVVLVNTTIGMIQEGKASRAFEALQKTIEKKSRVLRDGRLREINSKELVPGDIIFVEQGMSIDADARIITAKGLTANESSLTGEWIDQEKGAEVLPKSRPFLDRSNMLYSGTLVERGLGKALVVATGDDTELGKIAEELGKESDTQTPLQKNLTKISRLIGVAVLILALALFILGVLRDEPFREMFFVAVALAVSAVPEGLPVAVTVILALGMERILKKGGLLKRLRSAETLGSTNVILTDKTGTLTEGTMEVARLSPAGNSLAGKSQLIIAGVLASDAFIENPGDELSEWKIRGNETDSALLKAGVAAGILKEDLEKEQTLQEYFPFDPELMLAGALYKKGRTCTLYVTGAPEAILKRSAASSREYEELAGEGLRVLAGARKIFKSLPHDKEEYFKDLEFLGLIALRDPLRKDVKESLAIASKAGIRTIIVTGDHKLTAKAIAKELGMEVDDNRVVEGSDIEKNPRALDVENVDIFARILPHQKSLIVAAWDQKGAVVAMTGDGINDATALKRAHIGVALGSGTEVAKEAADLILLDNSFSTIVAAIEEGRTIIDNLRKVVTFLLATGFTEVVLIGSALVLGYPLPVLPAQILWMNLVGEGFFNFAFAFEKKERDVLAQKPQANKFFTREMKALIVVVALVNDLFLLGMYLFFLNRGFPIEVIRTIIFAGLAINAFFFVFALRSLRRPLWKINFFSNPYLIFAFFVSLLLLLPPFFVPFLSNLLHIESVPFIYFAALVVLGILDLVVIEALKYYFISNDKLD